METPKRKISIRKVIQTLLTIVLVSGTVMAIVSAGAKQDKRKIKAINIHIANDKTVQFVNSDEVKDVLFKTCNIDPDKVTMHTLDVNKMEKILKSNPWITEAEVYIDNKQQLYANIVQAVPVIRIFERSGNSYYLDNQLRVVPLSENYVHYVPVVTNLPRLEDDSVSTAIKGNALGLMKRITANKFWNAQIAEVVYAGNCNYELVPVLGKQRILLGDTTDLKEKLNKLFAFYKQVSNKLGWTRYETIDLRFKDQVVASPAIAWNKPKDAALLNMNWVTAVMESAPKDNTDESIANVLDTGIVADRLPSDDIPTPRVVSTTNNVQPQPVPQPVAPAVVKPIHTPPAQPAKPVVTAVKKDIPKTVDKKPQAKPVVATKKVEDKKTSTVEKPVVAAAAQQIKKTNEKKEDKKKEVKKPEAEQKKTTYDKKEKQQPKAIYTPNTNN